MALALRLNMVNISLLPHAQFKLKSGLAAEFRGPGVRRNLEDSGDDYDLDSDQRGRGNGGRSGRIILLGDGAEVHTDSDETEMFDHEEEDKDLDSQAATGQLLANDTSRGAREETPGPEAPETTQKNHIPTSADRDAASSTARNSSDRNESTKPKVIPESALPDKIVTQSSIQEK